MSWPSLSCMFLNMQTMANKAWSIFLFLGVTVSLSHGHFGTGNLLRAVIRLKFWKLLWYLVVRIVIVGYFGIDF